jgi:hypothetical protein
MSVDQKNVVDFVGYSYEPKRMFMAISDHLPWDELEDFHLSLLDHKIRSYLHFIENGQFAKRFPAFLDSRIIIEVLGKYPLSNKANKFFERMRRVVEDEGLELRFTLSPEG